MHPIHDHRKDSTPEPLTEELLDYFSEQTRRAARRAVINYSRGALVGFFILLGGIGLVQYSQNEANEKAQKALVKSGQAVAVDGCNRDFEIISRIRALLERLSEANEISYHKGDISLEQYNTAQRFYADEIAKQKLPDCRDARDILTNDPNEPIKVPEARYPKEG